MTTTLMLLREMLRTRPRWTKMRSKALAKQLSMAMLTQQSKASKNMNSQCQPNNYVHIALNNEFQTWKEGSDFINALAWELGLPEHALTDRTIEKNHVQFKVEPNDLDVDASRIADALNDISIKRGLVTVSRREPCQKVLWAWTSPT